MIVCHWLKCFEIDQQNVCCYTSTKSWRGYIFTSVCLCVCVCVCLSGFLVNKIPAERMHRFWRGFRQMVAYNTGSDPIEFGNLGSKVKVTVTENVCKNDEQWWKKFAKISNLDIFEIRSHHLIGNFIAVIWYQIWPYCTINNSKNCQWKFLKK